MSRITQFKPEYDVISIIENNPNLQPLTKDRYITAIKNYLKTGHSLSDANALANYASTLSKSGRAFLKSAIRLWGNDISLNAKANANPENIGAVQATIYRIEALNESIKVPATKGQKAHTWLNQAEVKKLLSTCDPSTIQGKRDRVVLGLLVGAGLRREELANLTFNDILIQPIGSRERTVLNVKGKGAKDRVVPISAELTEILNVWGKEVYHRGNIAKSINKGGRIGKSISVIGIFDIVSNAGQKIGKPELAPHDLRRTYAQLGYEAGVPITQISKLLGHSNVATTQRYLNLDLDLETTISDCIHLG